MVAVEPTRTQLGLVAQDLKEALVRHGFTAAGVASFLGPHANDALFRGEPGAVSFSLRGRENAPLSVLIRLFLLHLPTDRSLVDDVLGAALTRKIIDAGVVGYVGTRIGNIGQPGIASGVVDESQLHALMDVRPHVINGVNRIVFSDMDASMVLGHVPGADHVLGVGAASLSLLSTSATTPVESVLDVGTGSGIQTLGQLRCAQRIVATDVHPRALDLAEATLVGEDDASGHASVSLREGSWFEPASGERFDRIVSNPPFVVGLPEVGHVYRDSGLNLDGATEMIVSQSPDYLNEGGTAHILGAWIHQEGQSWQQRVASWIPSHGVAAWVLQRDIADPALYVGTWLKDESIDPRSPEAAERTQAWLQHFADNKVSGIGFGYVAIQKLDDDTPSEIVAEDLAGNIVGTLGEEIEEYFLRTGWLRDATKEDILSSQYALRPGVAKEEIAIPDASIGMGFTPFAIRLSRTEGPCFSHEVDEHIATIVAGLHPQGMSLAEVVELYSMSKGVDEEDLLQAVIAPIVDSVRHGLLLPAELLSQN